MVVSRGTINTVPAHHRAPRTTNDMTPEALTTIANTLAWRLNFLVAERRALEAGTPSPSIAPQLVDALAPQLVEVINRDIDQINAAYREVQMAMA